MYSLKNKKTYWIRSICCSNAVIIAVVIAAVDPLAFAQLSVLQPFVVINATAVTVVAAAAAVIVVIVVAVVVIVIVVVAVVVAVIF